MPTLISRSHDHDCTIQALQAAMILRAGGRLDHPAYPKLGAKIPEFLRTGINDAERNRHMDAAHIYRGMSMMDMAREALRIDGYRGHWDQQSVLEASFSSGNSLTNIFTTSANAKLLTAYSDESDTTEGWVSEDDVNDFKTNERTRTLIESGLQKLPRGGEADHAVESDTAETYKIARYSKQFQVDDQDIIDDNFGALKEKPTKFGQAAKRLRPDLVYSILLANPTLAQTAVALFSASNPQSNLLTGAAFAAATFRAAIAAMAKFQENGVSLNLDATHVIVPTDLSDLAYELVKSQFIVIAGTALTERGSINAIGQRGIMPVSDARLANGLTDPSSGTAYSGSTSTWFIASADAHTIEVGYLRGTGRVPQVRDFILGQGKWGMGWDVKMDIGAKALDWRGLVKNTA